MLFKILFLNYEILEGGSALELFYNRSSINLLHIPPTRPPTSTIFCVYIKFLLLSYSLLAIFQMCWLLNLISWQNYIESVTLSWPIYLTPENFHSFWAVK
jgi:hypothetical protein